jgi:NOL1/NOP2/fmu family ribosome biogenesis protein
MPGFTSTVQLDPSDPRVERYLTGHPIDCDGLPGWTPVTVSGFALGWGKRVGSTIKNHYPKGLRQRGQG